MKDANYFLAHKIDEREQKLEEHLNNTAKLSEQFAAVFGKGFLQVVPCVGAWIEKTVAVVGPSGRGKTTLTKLLQRFGKRIIVPLLRMEKRQSTVL